VEPKKPRDVVSGEARVLLRRSEVLRRWPVLVPNGSVKAER